MMTSSHVHVYMHMHRHVFTWNGDRIDERKGGTLRGRDMVRGRAIGGWDGQRVGTREDEGEMIMKYQ